ncbi:MAG: FtsB family cell division protein [Sphingomonas sp.]
MTRTTLLSSTLRRAGPPTLAFCVMAFFGGYAVLGPNGILAYGDYTRQLARKQVEFAALNTRRAVLRNHVALVDPRHADPDMADELVRKQLNVMHPDEVSIPLD